MAKGPKRLIESGEEFLKLFCGFCEELAETGFMTAPTQFEFCRWLKRQDEKFKTVCTYTIYNCINEYYPDYKKDYDNVLADTLEAGGMSGRYNSTMCIFSLKNRCGWVDTAKYAVTAQKSEEDPITRAIKDSFKNAKRKAEKNP